MTLFSGAKHKKEAKIIQENGMEINPLKTIFQSFSLPHQSINSQLKYNGSNIEHANKNECFDKSI